MAKCAECGFLAVRNVQTRQLEEMEEDYRRTGNSPQVWGDSPPYNMYEAPICFLLVFDLPNEIAKQQGPLPEGICLVINEERTCEPFIKRRLGSTPKEHQEMIDRQALLKWQAEREDKDRESRKEESKENRKWRFREFIVAVLALAVIVAASIIGALIQRGGQPIINITTTNPPNITVQH
jgi:hypothetical protein